LPLGIIVKATHNPEGDGAIGIAAFDEAKQRVRVTQETNLVILPNVASRTKSAGLVATSVAGDQLSLLIALFRV
jgi:predicted homoserine dehydrogenase-like protein